MRVPDVSVSLGSGIVCCASAGRMGCNTLLSPPVISSAPCKAQREQSPLGQLAGKDAPHSAQKFASGMMLAGCVTASTRYKGKQGERLRRNSCAEQISRSHLINRKGVR